MATYYRHSCGHTSTRDPWGRGADLDVRSLCGACQAARVGEEIAFVRYGKPPVSGCSTNHRERTAEAGVSVYELVEGEPRHVGFHFGITDRPAYHGRGIIVGWGSDGEPLVRIIGRIKKMP